MIKIYIFLIAFLFVFCSSKALEPPDPDISGDKNIKTTDEQSDGSLDGYRLDIDTDWMDTDYSFIVPLTATVKKNKLEQDTFSLQPNHPNPFNPATRIDYSLGEKTHVKISILNSNKQEVDILADEIKPAGKYSVVWYGIDKNAYAVESGIYYCEIKAGEFVELQKMILRR
jgi:hypothetical protein